MDIETAKRFHAHAEEAIKQLNLALILAQDKGSNDEFLAIRKLMGDIIARVDGVLWESIYNDHPELRKYGNS
jgi:hypothetical protein